MQIDTAKQFTPWHTHKSGNDFLIIMQLYSRQSTVKFYQSLKVIERLCGILNTQKVGKFTSTSNSLSDCRNDISGVKTSYEKWSDRLNSTCFSKRRIKKSKQIYDSKSRQLINKRKKLKRNTGTSK